ncbi:MAG: hypothetical protein U1E67_10710 [Hyphomicrobiales bacterium]
MSTSRNIFLTAQAIQADIGKELGPPPEGLRSRTQGVILFSLVRGTRGYIERVANQANGAYENGWYDACAVMLRRLIETLIIEAFEHHNIVSKIKSQSGDFFYLRDLIDKSLNEPTWNLSRNCKRALPALKDVGDKSAHSRRYNAVRGDIDPLLTDIRIVVQEFLYLSGMK